MNNHRKETIIKEIDYWKRNRLLPDQYCDYLLALYTEGEAVNQTAKGSKKLFPLFFACLISLLVPITFLVIYFTEMPVHLQMLLVTFFVLLSIFGYFIFRKEESFIHIPVFVLALLILILSIKLLEILSIQLPLTFIIITFQTLIWFFIGYVKKWYYLNISAIITMVLLVANIILM
ncbi:hypothetical protein FZC76_07455 [Sutcliffiella horikoshii]|uniref:DUF2157 domain-containing protein n=1 Tax=Sutcliffiella horikoshii TaxID=79883 RepID=A0A5D4T1D7_9BACI|nr:hypothetical protein [Sutcliffiella horikoshii]TYS68771.1 hypothetical protein FZC76_07455 [Sutcliffiella horikoshii]